MGYTKSLSIEAYIGMQNLETNFRVVTMEHDQTNCGIMITSSNHTAGNAYGKIARTRDIALGLHVRYFQWRL